MQLTQFSDYSLRVLMYAATQKERLVTIDETAKKYEISRAHLMKVVNFLIHKGYLRGVRGRTGGFTLARKPEDIRIDDVLRAAEPGFDMAECFSSGSRCMIAPACRLKGILAGALAAFWKALEGYTLEDIVKDPQTSRIISLFDPA